MEASAIFAQILYGAAAAFSLLYYLPCALYWGWYGKELAAVLGAGIGSAAALVITAIWGMTPFLWVCFAIFLLGVSVFFYIEANILLGMNASPGAVPEWLLVPGYKPRKGAIPAVLMCRTEKAAGILCAHKKTRAVLSGGYTDGAVSEAEIMERLLTGAGIDPGRLVREDRSTTTRENMCFCRELTGGETIGLVTNGFHLYRACGEAKKAGFTNVIGFRAGNGPGWLLPYHMAREFMTVVNDKANGFL